MLIASRQLRLSKPSAPSIHQLHRGPIERVPDHHRALHWAQARTYGWLLCEQEGWAEVEVALVYFDLDDQTETVLSESHSAADLRDHFETLCERFLHWADQEADHRTRRDEALRQLAFPFGHFRAGQRELAEAVYRAHTHHRCLLAQAPTGIGKTVGTLFPALRAMPPTSTTDSRTGFTNGCRPAASDTRSATRYATKVSVSHSSGVCVR